jgi:hypothetical protein
MNPLKKNNLIFGFVLGLIFPILGIVAYRYTKLQVFSWTEVRQYLMYEPGHKMLTVALSLSLLLNAVVFTVYINGHIDKTAKGIFAATVLYGLTILAIKTFS